MRTVNVEFFFSGGCSNCAEARGALRAAAESVPNVEWREVDIGKNPRRAVDAGVVSTPAVAIDGELVFRTSPAPTELRAAIEARLRKA